MAENIIIPNKEELEKKKEAFRESGVNSIHVVSDFDRTLTYGTDERGGKTKTVISMLRSDPKYLGQEYVDKSTELFNTYYPYEISSEISREERQRIMHEWWRKHFEFLKYYGLSKDIIYQVVREKPVEFREGAKDFLKSLNDNNPPVIIMSASPGDMVEEYMKKDDVLFPNTKILGNRYNFDSEGKAVSIKEPIIHVANKNEISLRNSSIYDNIKERKNVILLGDSLGDTEMSEGFPYENIIKIGFLNVIDFSSEENQKRLEEYKNNFDVVLTGDQDFDYINKTVKELMS